MFIIAIVFVGLSHFKAMKCVSMCNQPFQPWSTIVDINSK